MCVVREQACESAQKCVKVSNKPRLRINEPLQKIHSIFCSFFSFDGPILSPLAILFFWGISPLRCSSDAQDVFSVSHDSYNIRMAAEREFRTMYN